jgi:multidrug resistance efflux pump
LKYVANGQPVEVALNLYPGQIFKARVAAIWKASGTGQLLPSGTLPTFQPTAPETPQSQYAVKIVFDAADQSKFPIGAQGAAAIYTGGMKGAWAALRRIGIRTYSWLNWLYPIPF